MVIYKKRFQRYATSPGRMTFKTKYLNCRHNFGKTRPMNWFSGLGENYIFSGKIVFVICLTKIFLSTTKCGGHKNIWDNCPRMLPCLLAWAGPSPESLPLGAFMFLQGG